MKTITFIILIFCSLCIKAQNKGVRFEANTTEVEAKGKTYALIVGISKYFDKGLPQLQFADNDAYHFYRFLRSKTGGNVDSNNIRMLLNSNAKSTDIWREIQWILRRADSSDKVYIYFSGHGDGGNNSEDVYLLTYETAKVDDAGLYVPTSALPVMSLKTKIKTLIHKNVEVMLITDACRTNELPGKKDGSAMLYKNIMDENLSLLQTQVASCKANQESQEGKQWGNGRGVFSFHLVNGLMGLADFEPPDGKVTLEELETYVKENVKHDTRSLSTGEPLQVPVFSGRNKTICYVDDIEKDQIVAAIAPTGSKKSFEFAARKSVLMLKNVDSSTYSNLVRAIEEDRLIIPVNNCAVYWTDNLLEKTKDNLARADIADQTIAALMNKGQEPINYYNEGLKSSEKFTYEYYMNGANHFRAALKYLQNNAEMYRQADASRLFLEARALEISDNKKDWENAISSIDSSLALANWAYSYQTKSIAFQNLGMNDSIPAVAAKAISIAPIWSSPYTITGIAYVAMGMPVMAKSFLMKGMQLNPKDEKAVASMSSLCTQLKEYDSAIYFAKMGMAVNPGNAAACNNIGLNFEEYKQTDSAIFYYSKAIQINPKDEVPCFNLGNTYGNQNQYDSAIYFFKKAVELKPRFAEAYFNLGIIYYKQKQFGNAIDAFKKLVEINPQSKEGNYLLVCCYSLNKDKANALLYIETLLKNGTNYFEDASEDADLNYIRKEKEFKDLLKKYPAVQEK